MKQYNHSIIEQKWRSLWRQDVYHTKDTVEGKENFYLLMEFPYPSGDLHAGHWYAYSVNDIYARYLRMRGKNVLFPFGFDAFGLPAENAAIKRGLDPAKWTKENIEHMKAQISLIGTSIDWSREIQTIDPQYYKWTQWIFSRMYENNLAYQKKGTVNWCESCKTVLANEQVVNGRCDRCGSVVEQKQMNQWFLRITKYADRLIDDLDSLPWQHSIKEAQKNWIGRSKGALLSFPTTIKRNYVCLHGYQADSRSNFWPSLKKELESKGHKVHIPDLPNTDDPNIEKQVEYVLNNIKFDSNTVLVAHSLGTVIALKVLEKIQHRIAKTILIAPFLETKKQRNYIITTTWEYDFDTIISHAGEVTILQADKDTAVSESQCRSVHSAIGGTYHIVRVEENHGIGENEKEIVAYCQDVLHVFTTRPDTVYGVTHFVIAPEHPLILSWKDSIENWNEVSAYIEQSKTKSELERQLHKDKTGLLIKGLFIQHPLTHEKLPIFVSDYVLYGYGTGAIMSVPAHDQRDLEFAEHHGIIPKKVIDSESDDTKGILINSDIYNGKKSDEAALEIVEHMGGKITKTYRLRDWSISRQRYWGTPIPIVYDPSGNPHLVKDEHLPWLLPTDVDHIPDGTAPLARSNELAQRVVQLYGEGWTPEVETMDTFVDSSWYFLRYLDPHNHKELCSKDAQKNWMPVTYYSGGAEHTTMHLLYSRFYHKALYDLGYVTTQEPYELRMNRSVILGPDGHKMSKSKGNVINPDEEVKRVGADALRMYLAFIGPYGQVSNYPWSTTSLIGMRKFLDKVWNAQQWIVDTYSHDEVEKTHTIALHRTIFEINQDITNLKFNTALSEIMKLFNVFSLKKQLSKVHWDTFVTLLSPYAPYICEELWQKTHSKSIFEEKYPFVEENITSEYVSIAIQINGKIRGRIQISPDTSKDAVLEHIMTIENIQKWLTAEIHTVHYVPGKVFSITLKNS